MEIAAEQPQPETNFSSSHQIQVSPDANLTMWQLSLDDIYRELEENLRGRYWIQTAEGGEWKKTTRALNEKGISGIMRIVRLMVNKNNILSNLNDQDIYNICRVLNIELAKSVIINAEEYEIESYQIPVLLDAIMNFIFCALKRAKDEGERKALRVMEKRVESVEHAKPGHKWFPF